MNQSRFHLLWKDRRVFSQFRTGVSLHSHTMYSNESLGMIPRYTHNVPWLGPAIRKQEDLYLRNTGQKLDFNRAFWTPPLHPQQAYLLERTQLEKELGVAGLVSLSDHDNIDAGSLLTMIDAANNHPVSVEWTIPMGPSFFHLGIHNLPPQRSASIMESLAEYTKDPSKPILSELLDMLNAIPEVLVVLNHPLWDESGCGAEEHNRLLGRLLERHGHQFHALELNGLRTWKENAGVIKLASEAKMPIISGGDRHGCEPNATVNVTNASTFAEFVSEVRYDKVSEVVFMQQYREPMRLRVLQTMWDIVRDYDDQPHGRRYWNDRIFFRQADGSVQPLSAIWQGEGPRVVRRFLGLVRLVEYSSIRKALRRALHDREEFVLEP